MRKERSSKEGEIGRILKDGKEIDILIGIYGLQGIRKLLELPYTDKDGGEYHFIDHKPVKFCKCEEIYFDKPKEKK